MIQARDLIPFMIDRLSLPVQLHIIGNATTEVLDPELKQIVTACEIQIGRWPRS
ncbi:MAG: hypothetical protein JO300_01070 [Silvibacterium sp.]|nr:hypothetical protein [Silvibacterium sp.]